MLFDRPALTVSTLEIQHPGGEIIPGSDHLLRQSDSILNLNSITVGILGRDQFEKWNGDSEGREINLFSAASKPLRRLLENTSLSFLFSRVCFAFTLTSTHGFSQNPN